MRFLRKNGSVSNLFRVTLRRSDTGQGLTGITGASSGLIISTIADVEAAATAYTASGSSIDSITTLGTFAAPTSGHCRLKEVDATNHPGLYELQLADTRFAVASAKQLNVTISGAANLLVKELLVQLTTTDDDDVNGGLQGLKGTTNPTAGALLTQGTGTGQVNASGGKVPATVASGDAVDVAPLSTGTAQSGTSTTITLAAGESSANDHYRSRLIKITGGTCAGQVRFCTAYNGITKVLTVDRSWDFGTTPDNTSVYAIVTWGSVNVAQWASGNVQANATGIPVVDLTYFLGHAFSETTGGNIAAAFKKLLDVASPVLTAASSNQSGDGYGVLTNGSYGLSALLGAITNLNNLTALANLFGPTTLVRPSSGSIAYAFTLTIRDSEGHLVDADATPTLAAANAAGTDRSAHISAVTHASVGVYTFTYTVQSTDADEGLAMDATCAVSSSARRADLNFAVADADSLSALAAIQAKTDKLTFDGSNNVLSTPQTAVQLANSQPNYAPAKAGDAMTLTSAYDAAKTAAAASQIPADFTSGSFASPGVFSVAALANAPGGTGNVTVGGYASGQDPATLVLNAVNASYNSPGSVGHNINASGSATDPWGGILTPQQAATLLRAAAAILAGNISPESADHTTTTFLDALDGTTTRVTSTQTPTTRDVTIH